MSLECFFYDFHDSGMEFYEFHDFRNSGMISLNFQDFLDSVMQFYKLHDFSVLWRGIIKFKCFFFDSVMNFFAFHDFRNSGAEQF